MLNEVRLIGRLKEDPAIEYTAGGHCKVDFVLIQDRPRYNPEREQPELKQVFLGCVAWHQVAERIGESYRRGDLVLIMGELEQQEITGPRGGTQTKTKVNVLTVQTLRLLPRDKPADGWA